MGKLIKILKLGRFQFLMAGLFLYTIGALFATLNTGEFSWLQFWWGYAILMPAHLSISYSNDYFDLEVDKLAPPTNFTGGSGILVENPELRNFAKQFAIFLIILSLLIALLFSWKYSSPEIFILAIFGNFLGWFYSAPPIKLSYNGFGEISTIITGFIIPALGYLAMVGYIDLKLFLFTIPIMIFQLLFICSVEIPDLESDSKGGKNTLIVRKGREFGFKIMGICSILGTIIFFALSYAKIYPPIINFNIISIISIILLIPSVIGFLIRPNTKRKSTELSEKILISLILFSALTAFYFAYTTFILLS